MRTTIEAAETVLSARVPLSLNERLQEFARSQERSVSAEVRIAIRERLDREQPRGAA